MDLWKSLVKKLFQMTPPPKPLPSYSVLAAADEGPRRQQVSGQPHDEDEDVEDDEGPHVVVDDALGRPAGAGVGGVGHPDVG